MIVAAGPARKPAASAIPSSAPSVFISYRVGDVPKAGLRKHPWEVADCDCILVNAFDFLANRRTRAVSQEFFKKGLSIHEHLGHEGPIWMDSGAFNFISNPTLGVAPKDVWEVGVKVRADAIVTLDHPFPPGVPPQEVVRRVGVTIANAVEMASLRTEGSPLLVPVLHGHDRETLLRCVEGFAAFETDGPPVLGLGSLAMLAKFGSARSASRTIKMGRELAQSAHLHVFSVGSPLLMHFAFLAGASSVDTQAWVLSAAFKQVFVPGRPQIRLARRAIDEQGAEFQQKLDLTAQALLQDQSEGLELRDWDTGIPVVLRDLKDASEYLLDMVDEPGRPRIHHRACHNVQVMTSEARRFREAKDKADFVLRRMRNTPYLKAAEELAADLT